MLILSRRVNEKIVIGENIVVSVIEVRGDQVKIGIEAPKSVKVYREEVFEAIQNENKRAAEASIDRLPDIDIPAKDKPSA
jgi:carbon storage regulator